MARPQVVDGRTVYNMEGSCKYIKISGRGQPTRGSPLAWILGEVVRTP